MHASRTCGFVTVCLAGSLMAAAAQAQTLRLGGTGGALGMMRQVGAEFTAAAEIKLDIVSSLGSTGAIRALADGVIDIAVSARPLKADEAAAGLRQVTVMRTAYVFATSHHNPNALKSTDLPRIFAAEKAIWSDGATIRIILRPRSEADTALLGKLFPGMDAALETALKKAVDYEKKHPGKPISVQLEKVKKFQDPVWRIIWGESVGTSDFSVFVDASTGEYKETLH